MSESFASIPCDLALELATKRIDSIETYYARERKAAWERLMQPTTSFFGMIKHRALTKEEAIIEIKKDRDWGSIWDRIGWDYQSSLSVCRRVKRITEVEIGNNESEIVLGYDALKRIQYIKA